MSKEREYEELYDRLLREVSTLHRNNRRIRIGMKMLVAVTVGLMLLMFLSQGNKIFALMLWILSMFAVAAYLIAVEYADYELQKKLEYITQMQQQSMFFLVPQMLTLVLGFVWWLGLVFMYSLMVSYKMKFGQVIKNGLMLAIARLPMTIGVRLATLIPTGIAFVVALLVPNGFLYAMMGLAGYYLILGNSMTRFVDASFTNAVFDKYINSRIEGVEINRGLAKEEDDDYTDEDEPEDDHPAAQQ